MDLVGRYYIQIEQLHKTKEFLTQLNPVDYKLTSFLVSLDQEIQNAEETLRSLNEKSQIHYCGICHRPCGESQMTRIQHLNVCNTCREQGQCWKLGTCWEQEYYLPKGRIKRDTLSRNGKPPKLQPFIDAGLIHYSGIHCYVHQKVIEMYYLNDMYNPQKT